jgi:hypothetical protein
VAEVPLARRRAAAGGDDGLAGALRCAVSDTRRSSAVLRSAVQAGSVLLHAPAARRRSSLAAQALQRKS